jgi:N-acetylglucosaminyldiphosphoundecaprenol N-acetyl-beta-D-mannosaminyltransferase
MSIAVQTKTSDSFHASLRPIEPDFSRQAFCIQGLLCDVMTIEEVKQKIAAAVKEARRCSIVTPNANFLRLIRSDPEFRDAVLASDLSVIDGMPLVWFARALGIAVSDRTCGSDLFDSLMRQTSDRFSAFFFGATDDIGQRVRKRLNEGTWGVRCAGVYAPGFGSVESMSGAGILDIINQAGADLLIVSVGARKGLLWLNRNEDLLEPPIICNLGATITFVAGNVKRAPTFFRRHGLEWLWRVKEEPALWTRYARDLITLISVLFGHILPYLAERGLHRPSATQLAAARLQRYQRGAAEILEFSGAWTKDNLAPVRAALAAATQTARDLVIDLDRATFVDAAFLGQLLLAYGYQRRMRRGFLLRATGRRIRKMLRLHGCGYLRLAGGNNFEAGQTASLAHPTETQRARGLWQATIASPGTSWINSHRR